MTHDELSRTEYGIVTVEVQKIQGMEKRILVLNMGRKAMKHQTEQGHVVVQLMSGPQQG